jgi:hypothetical protein
MDGKPRVEIMLSICSRALLDDFGLFAIASVTVLRFDTNSLLMLSPYAFRLALLMNISMAVKKSSSDIFPTSMPLSFRIMVINDFVIIRFRSFML